MSLFFGLLAYQTEIFSEQQLHSYFEPDFLYLLLLKLYLWNQPVVTYKLKFKRDSGKLTGESFSLKRSEHLYWRSTGILKS